MNEFKNNKIFLTGATSHTGCHLVNLFQKHNIPLRLLIRNPKRLNRLPAGNYEVIEADLTQPEAYFEMMKGCDLVLHLAHIRNGQSIVEACRMAGMRRLIVVSSTRKFTRFPDAISQAVEQGEYFVTNSGLDWTLLRPSMIFGDHRDQNIADLVNKVKRWPVFPLIGGGKTLSQPIFVSDLCDAIFQAVQHPKTIGKDYNLAGGSPISLREMLLEIKKQTGAKALLTGFSIGIALGMARIFDAMKGVKKEVGLAAKIQRLEEDKVYDISKAKTDLNFEPLNFSDGLKKKLEWQADHSTIYQK